MLDDLFARYNPWWEGPYKSPGIRRDRYIAQIDALVEKRRLVILFGLRRTGKTYILKQFIATKLEKIPADRLFFISMDHPAVKAYSIDDIINGYRQRFKLQRKEKVYVILDEIQKRDGFENDLKAVYDLEENVYIIATGSNSLAIRHKTGDLSGRHGRIKVNPLSFEEYLIFKGIQTKESEQYLKARYLEEYMSTGGIPDYVLTGDPQYVVDVVDDIIYKDIAARYDLKDPGLLKDLFYLLCNRVGKKLSHSKLARIMKLTDDTIRQYMTYFEETFLIQFVEKTGTPNERKYSPKKVYISDLGILNVFGQDMEKGAKAENLVYLRLKEKGDVSYIDTQKGEVDFLSGGQAIEVKYKDSISEEELKPIISLKGKNVKSRYVVGKKPGKIDDMPIIGLTEFMSADERRDK